MNAGAKAKAERLTVRQEHRVETLHRVDEAWIIDNDDAHRFDAVIVATQAEQAARMVASIAPAWAALARGCRSDPCWTALLAFDERIAILDGTIRNVGIIGWAARHSAKPDRGSDGTWVAQATPA